MPAAWRAAAFGLVPLCLAGPGVIHQAPPLPCGWQEVSPELLSEDGPVTVQFSLKQQGVESLRQAVERVSNPSSPSYGQYLTRVQVEALVAPAREDAAAVEGWLRAEGVDFGRPAAELVEVTLPASAAERLLHTRLRAVVNAGNGQQATLAEDFWLPAEVDAAVAAVYGLHGLPLPPRAALAAPEPREPANVTPSVIDQRYGVAGVKVSGSTKNRQAVAEFQGQLIAQKGLDKFFQLYVPGVGASASKIYKYVGNKAAGPSGVESALDVDYIMGVAPGVLTEYWYWGGMDFCLDLKNWTGTILSQDEPPLVHSVSYGWQGDLAQVGCKEANVKDVDVNLMKLAARGVSIILASGDSGSGYARSCGKADQAQDVALTGSLKSNMSIIGAELCCRYSDAFHAKAWTYVPPAAEAASVGASSGDAVGEPILPAAVGCGAPQKQVEFTGKKLAVYRVPPEIAESACCQLASGMQGPDIHGFTVVVDGQDNDTNTKTAKCTLFTEVSGHVPGAPGATSATFKAPPKGKCLLYSEVEGKETKAGAVSGGDEVSPTKPKLYPSWPASSPYVTAVGATRFVQQDVSAPEMATDQFGSGGGFSDMWPAFQAQVAAVQEYLKTAPKLPPNGSFPPGGRATPDVSALGEGYQVLINGDIQSIGGTSASAPMFAALVSLLNEARLAANKPPMGYLNPWLYAHPEAFTDVTLGTNAIGRGTGALPYGFPCTKGWDPATGLGTPIFGKMLAAALSAGDGAPQEIVV